MSEVSINKKTRKRFTELITGQEAADTTISGDYSGEGILDNFRKAEIWIPSEVYADYISNKDLDWYEMQFSVGFVPPEGQKITFARVSLNFQEPVRQIGAWFPNDTFSTYQKISTTSEVASDVTIGIPETLLGQFPDLKGLLPQFSAKYHRVYEENKEPAQSIVRTISDRQRRLSYDLNEDPKSGIDQRELVGQVLFGITPNINMEKLPVLLSLTINCRCGILQLKSEIVQDVDITFRRLSQ
jgi:hypothetical protein